MIYFLKLNIIFENESIKAKNSEILKQGSIQIAEESERAIVDVETLQKTNKDIIETLDRVIEIHENGRIKREEAEKEAVEAKDKYLPPIFALKVNNISSIPYPASTTGFVINSVTCSTILILPPNKY